MSKIKYDAPKDEHAKFVPPVERLLHDIRNAADPMAAGKRACRWLQGMLFTRSSPEADAVIHALIDRRIPVAQAKDKVVELVGGQKGRRRNPKRRHKIDASDLDNFVECERHYLGSKNRGAMLSSLGKPYDRSQKKVQPDKTTIRRVIGEALHGCLPIIRNNQKIIGRARYILREEMPGLEAEQRRLCLEAVVEMMRKLRDEGLLDSWDGKLSVDNSLAGFATKEMMISNRASLLGRPDWLVSREEQWRLKEVKTRGKIKQTSPILQLTAYRMIMMATPGFENVSRAADEVVVLRPAIPGAPAQARSYECKITDNDEMRVIRSVNKIADHIDRKSEWISDFSSLPASKKAGTGCHLCAGCPMRGTPACPETRGRGNRTSKPRRGS